MTHRKRSLWLSLCSLPIASGYLVSGLGCSARDDIAEPAAGDRGGSSGLGGDGGKGGDVATGGTTNTGGSSGNVGGTSSGGATGGSGGAMAGGSSGAGGGPSCVTGDGFLCAPSDLRGFPFVSFAVSYSYDGLCSVSPCPAGDTTVNMTQPEPGTLCLSGRVAPNEVLAGVNLHFATRNQDGTRVYVPFDAARLGITQIALTLDTPPPNGVHFSLSTVSRLECPGAPLDCSYGFTFGDLMEGSVTVPIADFVSNTNPGEAVDTSILDGLYFQVGPGDYDFCIHDFKLLDANGNEVRP